MTAGISRPSTEENISSTLSAGITDVATSFDIADASKLVQPCYLVIDRVDSAGSLKATSLWEYVKVTNISSNTLTVTRGANNSTPQSHSSGAVIEAVVTSAMFEEWYDVLNPEHTSTGGHIISTATINNANILSVASVAHLGVLTSLQINSAATVVGPGLQLNPVWVMSGFVSAATVGAGRPLVMPRSGTWQAFYMNNSLGASGSSVIVDINKNGTSIFDTVGRLTHPAAGTFASTASVKTKDFVKGDIFTVDIDAGQAGMWVKDLVVQGNTV